MTALCIEDHPTWPGYKLQVDAETLTRKDS